MRHVISAGWHTVVHVACSQVVEPMLIARWPAVPSLLRSLCLAVLAIVCLSGCVDYGISVEFASPHQGELVQHIHFGEQLNVLGSSTVQEWLQAIDQRATALGGKVQRRPNQDVVVRIPFHSSHELEQRFNWFFTGDDRGHGASQLLPEIPSRLTIHHSNFLVAERDELHYDLDLRSLGVTSLDGSILVSPSSLIDLQFTLETPLGAVGQSRGATGLPRRNHQGKRLVWTLVPGEQNHLEARFWLPSPLGIGGVVITGIVLIGMYLKYPVWFNRQHTTTLDFQSSQQSPS